MASTLKCLRVIGPGTTLALLGACGGGSSGSSPPVTTYDVTASAGTGGTVSPASATVDSGGTTSFTVTPSGGYAISGVTGCGGTLSGDIYTTGAVTASCAVTASFVAQYTVTSTAGSGGTVTPASATVDAAGTTTFMVTPNAGYVISGVTGCGGTLSGSTYTTGDVDASCTVTASFSAAFTWVGGSNTPGASGVYGTEGVAAAANVPGSRDGGSTWTDANGNLWLFGGFEGYVNAINPATGNFLNDLWEYSPASGEWTWVGGSSAACTQGVYGTQGVAAAANLPGPRSATTTWTDGSGNVWLFGGGGCDSTGAFLWYDDLWKFSPSTGEWTWVGGSTAANATGVYGSEGVAAPTNMPGGRGGFAKWTDASGNLWLFGGAAWDATTASEGYLSDLWEYSPSSGEWTWISGADTFNARGDYGTQGAAVGTNAPGARWAALSWTDAKGNFWLFGGEGYDSAGQTGELNDLWEFSPSSGEWTWVNGASTANATGVYGAQGVAAAANVPSPRDSAANWIDASGNLWVFGGEGFLVSTGFYHRFNDLWKYSPSSDEWTWMAGSSTFDATGVYGTQGTAAAANVPGARAAIISWRDANGNAWIFGGYTYDDPTNTRFEMNDLWKYPTQ
ncbi:MAG: kelch repeat-containing protein [Steroidobacteraceae bacterium]